MARDSLLWGLSRSYHLVFSICRGDSMTPLNLRRREGGVILVVPEIRYRIYSNKRHGAYLIFRATSAALIRGRRLFKNCTIDIYFFCIFIQRYTFYLLIFLWTDTI